MFQKPLGVILTPSLRTGRVKIRKISYVNWLDFVYCLKFTSLKPNQVNK